MRYTSTCTWRPLVGLEGVAPSLLGATLSTQSKLTPCSEYRKTDSTPALGLPWGLSPPSNEIRFLGGHHIGDILTSRSNAMAKSLPPVGYLALEEP